MHAVHHTHGVIIRSSPVGEANKRVWLFTEEFGLIVAAVQGVRKPMAKLQSQLIDYSFVSADLVKGKEVWRLISLTNTDMPLLGRTRDPLARAYVRTLAAVDRFLVGEGEENTALFQHLKECAECLKQGNYDVKVFDTLSLWRILALLGYISVDEEAESLYTLPFAEALVLVDDTTIKRLIAVVQDSITQSHL